MAKENTIKLRYQWSVGENEFSEEFDYSPDSEEIMDYLLQSKDIETVLVDLIDRFHDEILNGLKNEDRFVEFIINRHPAEEFEEEEYLKHCDEIEPSQEHILANL